MYGIDAGSGWLGGQRNIYKARKRPKTNKEYKKKKQETCVEEYRKREREKIVK